MFLTDIEIKELTGRKRRDCQIKALHSLKITFRLRDNGSIVVLRDHVERELGGKIEEKKIPAPFKFNWNHAHA